MTNRRIRDLQSLMRPMLLLIAPAILPGCAAFTPMPAESADMTIIHQSPDGRFACIEQQYEVDELDRPSFLFLLRIRRYLGCGRRRDSDDS
jgi:hypothetical protein